MKKENKIKINNKEWQDYLTETAYNQGKKDMKDSIIKELEAIKNRFNGGDMREYKVLSGVIGLIKKLNF